MQVALADARARYPISGEALNAFIDGGLQDTEQVRYADFDDLRSYCSRVAGAVGVACMAVYGADQPQRAEAMGIALQLINIMRDVDEDWSLGRVYIPQDELASFGVSEGDIAAGRCTSAWQALMAYQAARARTYLHGGQNAAAVSRPAERRLRRRVREPLRGDARAHRAVGLRRLRRRAAPVVVDEAPHRRHRPRLQVTAPGDAAGGAFAYPALFTSPGGLRPRLPRF